MNSISNDVSNIRLDQNVTVSYLNKSFGFHKILFSRLATFHATPWNSVFVWDTFYTALLRYNSHIIQFTDLMWFLV